MLQRRTERIVKELSEKYGIPEFVIQRIVTSQFKFLRKAMEEGTKGEPDTFKNVRFAKLGMFYAMKRKIRNYDRIKSAVRRSGKGEGDQEGHSDNTQDK